MRVSLRTAALTMSMNESERKVVNASRAEGRKRG